jgi:hypothetical protein
MRVANAPLIHPRFRFAQTRTSRVVVSMTSPGTGGPATITSGAVPIFGLPLGCMATGSPIMNVTSGNCDIDR